MEEMRINKYLSANGVCSRREADRLCDEGRVSVNGMPAGLGTVVHDGDEVAVDGKKVRSESRVQPVILAYNKPCGVVCSSSEKDGGISLLKAVDYGTRVYPVGRLDRDSHGLILLTNRGDIVNRINRASGAHEKEYIVRCSKPVTDGFLKKMSSGVEIMVPARKHDGSGTNKYTKVKTLPCKITRQDDFTFDIILTQGLNRQIRRMCGELGNNVLDLKRVRIMNIILGRLKEGTLRRVKGEELMELERLIVSDVQRRNANEP